MANRTEARRGILLATDDGQLLRPATWAAHKQLLPVFDKPMVYYPLSVLMFAGIQQILIVSTPEGVRGIERLLGNGRQLGLSFSYALHSQTESVARTVAKERDFLNTDQIGIVRGDSLFYGPQFDVALLQASTRMSGATIFAKRQRSSLPRECVKLDGNNLPVQFYAQWNEHEPCHNVTGMYVYDRQLCDILDGVLSSDDHSTWLTQINQAYLARGELRVSVLGADSPWFDLQTAEDILAAAVFVEMVEEEHQIKVGCIEEISHKRGFLSAGQMLALSEHIPNDYGRYLRAVAMRTRPISFDR